MKRLPASIVSVLVIALAVPSLAAPPKKGKKPPAAAPESPALAKAKDLFKQGIELFKAGDHERALDLFLRSREAYPSAVNTTNAAICLDKLKRYDEALELYEEVITKHASEIDDAERKSLAPAMAALRARVGSIDVSANVEGTVVVDGRPRGKLPLTTPLRAKPGERTVRVMKNGYLSKESVVTVKVGQTVKVDLELSPLASSGLVRVEDPAHGGFEVFVDRVSVGTVPWEGTLAPGKHVVWEQKGDLGSAPAAVQVIQAQTALVRLQAMKLGAPIRVELASGSAEVAVDGVGIGQGSWEGRLPEGQHTLVVSEEGYRPQSHKVLSAVDASGTTLRVTLDIDPDHPRWPRQGSFWVSAFGGPGFAPSVGSSAGARCGEGVCSKSGLGLGPLVGARFGYRFSFGLSLELGAAFTYLSRSISRTERATFGVDKSPVDYALDDRIRVVGPLVVGGVSYRLAIGQVFGVLARVGAGALFASGSDVMTGTASGGGDKDLKLSIERSGEVSRGAAAVLMPGLGVELHFGSLLVGAGASALAILTDGPTLPTDGVKVPAAGCSPTNAAAASCAPESKLVAGERAYGRSITISPEVSVGYRF
jgi:predicted RNA-binding protein with TRAM domain